MAHLLAGTARAPGSVWRCCWSARRRPIVAIVAVLKTGAAYLPIDPVLPATRIGFLLADATPIAVITSTALTDRLDGHDLPVIDIDDPHNRDLSGHRTRRRRPPTTLPT